MEANNTFRPLRRKKNAISDEQAIALLTGEKRGILAVNGDNDYPYAIPVNYYYDGEQNKIYFHGAKAGHKVDAIRRNDKVCFTVFGNEHYQADWAPYVQSTIVFGRCRLIEDEKVKESCLRRLAMRYYPSAEEVEAELAKDCHAAQLYEISVEHISGKQIHER